MHRVGRLALRFAAVRSFDEAGVGRVPRQIRLIINGAIEPVVVGSGVCRRLPEAVS